MKIVIKGGVWRNTEDEILKAAISKYGKNQWARISSLLVRKTPKQCKARWYEWLDPSIKKTEWSKEEDEKLLHLAKLMPTQWRTIAPIVGRTANQCLDRYQRLLDEAEQRELAEGDDDLGLAGTSGPEAGPTAEDIRRLRPGEVDPDPESKPARPDPIDMDEDEKEMLSEARARLANTQGKKAKRKARERQLEEARRLAMLQKKRELKAAGIMMRSKPKKKGMDYNADIPFEKKAAAGFYDVTEEKNKVLAAPIGRSLHHLEHGAKRSRAEEEEERRKKARKAQEAADKGAAAHFVPAKDSAFQRLKEEEAISKRRKLMLPEPQVGDVELEDIVKIGHAGETTRSLVDDQSGEGAANGLLGEYSALAHAQSARTPARTPATADNVMAEARNLRNMTIQQTPLLGEENATMHELVGRGTGFDGATPARQVAATPNPLATPRVMVADPGATPRDQRHVMGETPKQTPMRDNLSINEGATPRFRATPGETPRELKIRQQDAKSILRQGFLSLPKPKNDFELVLPEAEAERIEEVVEQAIEGVEDKSDRDAQAKAVREDEHRKALARRSQVVRRNLPRPTDFDPSVLLESLRLGDELETMICREMVGLLQHDAITYPVAGGKIAGGGKSSFPVFSDGSLREARSLVHTELATMSGFPGASEEALCKTLVADSEEFHRLWTTATQDYVYDAQTKSYQSISTLNEESRRQSMNVELGDIKKVMMEYSESATKLEKKCLKTLTGYQIRNQTLSSQLLKHVNDLSSVELELKCFEKLKQEEEGAKVRRIESLKEEVKKLESRQREGQLRYKESSECKERLSSGIEDMMTELLMRQAEAANEDATADMEA